jgi:hypothetical protein
MNPKMLFCLKISLFVIFAVSFEELILYNKLIVITSIQFAPLLAYILLVLFFKNMYIQLLLILVKKLS